MSATTATSSAKFNDKATLIQRLLAKAESTTAAEAEALTAAAERLMVKHGVDQAMIDARRAADGTTRESVVERSMEFHGQHGPGMFLMASAVAEAFGTVRLLQSVVRRTRGVNGKRLYVIGFESDVAQVETLVASLQLQAAVAMREWWATAKDDFVGSGQYPVKQAKRSFLVGFGEGAAARIRTATRETVADAEAAVPGTALAVRNRRADVDVWVGEQYPDLGKGRGLSTGVGGRAAGYDAGQRANTGNRAVSGRAALGR